MKKFPAQVHYAYIPVPASSTGKDIAHRTRYKVLPDQGSICPTALWRRALELGSNLRRFESRSGSAPLKRKCKEYVTQNFVILVFFRCSAYFSFTYISFTSISSCLFTIY